MHPRTKAVNLSHHSLLMEAYEVCRAIEECGASEKLTNAASKASELMQGIANVVDDIRDSNLEQERCIRAFATWLENAKIMSAPLALQLSREICQVKPLSGH